MPSTRRGGASREIQAPLTIVAYAHRTERAAAHLTREKVAGEIFQARVDRNRRDGLYIACNTESAIDVIAMVGGYHGVRVRLSILAQRDHRIHPGRATRRDITRQECDHPEHQRHGCVRYRVGRLHAEKETAQKPARGKARRRADDEADEDELPTHHKHQAKDVAARCAERQAHAEFVRSHRDVE